MSNRIKLTRRMVVAVVLLAMISLACNFSVGAPNLGQQDPTRPAFPQSQVITSTPRAGANQPGETANQATPQIPETGQQQQPGQMAPPVTNPPKNLEELYDRANPGVVSILVEVSQGGQTGAGAGSGVILTEDGYIATNHHVIDGANTIIVRFYNDADIQAKVIGDDPNSDLAIIKVDRMAEGAKPLPLGDLNDVRVGDAVVAIGNPFALGTSMSAGIISAVGRTIPSGFTPYNIPEAIQTDAAINPGNSGGPLINMRGEVIGINAQIRTGSEGGGNIGVGFAIPVNILKRIFPSLVQNGSYAWPYLGVGSTIQDPLALSAQNTEAQRGALIDNVEPGGPSARAGLREGDIVTQADDQKITNFDDLLTYIAYKSPGDQVKLTIMRGNQSQQITVTLGQRPAGSQSLPQQ